MHSITRSTRTTRITRITRLCLLVLQAFVAVTAAAGGVALIAGSFAPSSRFVILPPPEYLEGSPFTSYLVPGVVLLVVVGGAHAVAFVLVLRRSGLGMLASVVTGCSCLIWIFVQMIFIPFSVLQAVYFAAGLLQIGCVLIALGLFSTDPDRSRPRR